MSARHLGFHYEDGNHALRDVSLPIYRNRVTALIGPSGCGKSTLLRVFNRIYEIHHRQRVDGEVLLDGKSIFAPSVDVIELRRRVCMVFQRPTPFPMSIYENVAYCIRLHRSLRRAELDAEVERALRGAALWDEVKDRRTAPAKALSGGQQQRLAIARALAVRPEVLLLDEPCGSIDPISAAKVEQTLEELRRDHTIVIVTHNLEQAARVSDYAGFMYLGEIVEFASRKALFMTPTDPRTRDFVEGRFG
jgi:phosphate transport system ATP-binding protein